MLIIKAEDGHIYSDPQELTISCKRIFGEERLVVGESCGGILADNNLLTDGYKYRVAVVNQAYDFIARILDSDECELMYRLPAEDWCIAFAHADVKFIYMEGLMRAAKCAVDCPSTVFEEMDSCAFYVDGNREKSN